MSTRGVRGSPISRPRRSKIILDLNVPAAPIEDMNDEGTSVRAEIQRGIPPNQQVSSQPPPPTFIDVDALEDEVVLSSPRAFQEARENARRNARTVVLDVDAEDHTGNKRRRILPQQTVINCEHYINLETYRVRKSQEPSRIVAPHPPPSPPKEPVFSCPICMGPMVEEMTTKCGHIFCKSCIKKALATQAKCPTCRKRVTMKEIIRVYLPATN